jgi:hypothetical protein
VVVAVVVALLGLTRVAGDPSFHSASGLICMKCHTMHYSENGTVPTQAAGFGMDADSGGPWPHLLLKQHVTDLCLACHDNTSGVPDVMTSDINAGTVTERAAGYFDAAVDALNAHGHNLNPDKVDSLCEACHFVGEFATAKVSCVECHDPHGNGKYRNLQWATDPDSTPDIRAFVNPTASGLDVYERENVHYGAPASGDWREVNNVCLDCHHVFSGDSYVREGGVCVRHPNTDSERGAAEEINQHPGTGQTDPAHWLAGSGNGFSISRLPFIVTFTPSGDPSGDYTTTGTVAENNEVFCLTCHKAHGSGYDNGIRWDYSGQGNNAGCQQCHNKG